MKTQVLALNPDCYQRHLIHSNDRLWAETNCYVDVWVELLHAWGFDPIAALPFTVAVDFEGDQWTFFKFPHGDLCDLFALDVQELAIWRPLVSHVEEQVGRGRPVLIELDSYFLPDTVGTAYQREHVKSTVAAIDIDVQNRELGYFHGQGFYRLQGEDFVNVFRLNGSAHPIVLPPYVEFVKRRSRAAPTGEALVDVSLKLLRRQLRLLPEANPFEKFRARFETDVQWLMDEPMETFHQYSFATLRQFGACYELAATYLRWLQTHNVSQLERPISAFSELSAGAKTMQFQLARAMSRKKPLDSALIDQMADKWKIATEDLKVSFL